MRRLVVWEVASLDGVCAPATEEGPFFEFIPGPEIEAYSIEQNKGVGTLLFGRVTHEGMAAYWSTQEGEIAEFMNNIPKIVFSRTLSEPGWKNSTLERRDPPSVVAGLKKGTGKDIFVFGSPTLASSLSAAGLVDEYRLGVVPVILGTGRRFRETIQGPFKLKYLETRSLGPNLLLVRLSPEDTPP